MAADASLPDPLRQVLRSAWRVYQEAQKARPRNHIGQRQALRRVAELARAGHDAGWSFPTLAEAVDASPQRIQQIVTEHPPSRRQLAALPAIADPPRAEPTPTTSTPPVTRGELTTRERDRLRRLADTAATVNRWTPRGSTARRDSELLSRLLYDLHTRRDVPWRDLAEAAGRSIISVRRRVQRHGYATLPPSVEPYRAGAHLDD